MVDKTFIEQIAKLWVTLGGNSFDVTLKWIDLRDCVEQFIKQKKKK